MKTHEIRLDGWSNPNIGMGGPLDQSNGLTFQRRGRLSQDVLEALYEEDAIAARVVNRLIDDAFREGWRFKRLEGTDASGNELNADDALERLGELKFNERFAQAARWGRLYGGSLLVTPVIGAGGPDTPLKRVPAGGLLSPYAVGGFDATPLYTDSGMGSPTYGQTLKYQIRGIDSTFELDASRAISFEPIPMPYEVTQNTQSRWGPSVLDRLFDRLARYGASQTQGLGTMWNASLLWIKFEGWRQLLGSKEGKARARTILENMYSNLRSTGLLGLDATDEMGSIDRQLSNLDAVMLRFRDSVAEGADMPREIIFNESPAGLNAGELSGPQELWFAVVTSWQRDQGTPRIKKFLDLAFQSWGWDVTGCEIEWKPLWTKSEETTAATEKTQAEADALRVQAGILEPDEIRSLRFPDMVPEIDLNLAEEGAAERQSQEADKLQDEALDGGQIAALVDIVGRVNAGEIPRDAAIAIVAASFPKVAHKAESLLGSAGLEVLDLRKPLPTAEADLADMPGDVVSVKEAGAILGVSGESVKRMIRNKKIRAWNLNGRYRVSKSELAQAAEYKIGE